MDLDESILGDFVTESKGLLKELSEVVSKLEETEDVFPEELLKEFALKIDRIMGAVKTLVQMDGSPEKNVGLVAIGKLAEVCKTMGYKAAEKKSATLMPFFAAFWADTIEVIDDLLGNFQDAAKTQEIVKTFPGILQNRLKWLQSKIQ